MTSDQEQLHGNLTPKLIASTGDDYNYSSSSKAQDNLENIKTPSNPWNNGFSTAFCSPSDFGLFKSVHLSGDGTTLVSSSADNVVRTFVLPPDLLTPSSEPKHLTPYTTHTLPTPTNAITLYPAFILSDPQTCLALVAPTHLPIRLLSTLSPSNSQIQATYPLIHAPTEAYTAPHSLLFSSPTHFLAGHSSAISTFDLSRDGEGPAHSLRTAYSWRARAAGASGSGLRGIVSAMHMSVEGLLAAGTFSRWVGVYDGRSGGVGVGEGVGVWDLSVAEGAGDVRRVLEGDVTMDGVGTCDGMGEGAGVTQVKWSGCGRYLVVAERASDGMSVWDVRVSGRRLAWLRGRRAETMQRVGTEVFGSEIWGGGTDGKLRVWKQAFGEREGVLGPSEEWAAHTNTVSAVVVHPYGGVVGTVSGSRGEVEREWEEYDGDGSGSEDEGQVSRNEGPTETAERLGLRATAAKAVVDNSLKIWAL